MSSNEILAGVTASQVISNVPAALLLSGFTGDLPALIIGVNLGGLGTLIASMASLISYKLIVREDSQVKRAYFRYFTAANICFLLVLLVFALLTNRLPAIRCGEPWARCGAPLSKKTFLPH